MNTVIFEFDYLHLRERPLGHDFNIFYDVVGEIDKVNVLKGQRDQFIYGIVAQNKSFYAFKRRMLKVCDRIDFVVTDIQSFD